MFPESLQCLRAITFTGWRIASCQIGKFQASNGPQLSSEPAVGDEAATRLQVMSGSRSHGLHIQPDRANVILTLICLLALKFRYFYWNGGRAGRKICKLQAYSYYADSKQ